MDGIFDACRSYELGLEDRDGAGSVELNCNRWGLGS